MYKCTSECDGNSRYREFFIFLVVSVPVSENIGTGKKSRNRYRKNLVPKKVLYRKKVLVSVLFNILGTVTHCFLPHFYPKKHQKSAKLPWHHNIKLFFFSSFNFYFCLWSNIWRVSSLKNQYFCPNSKTTFTHSKVDLDPRDMASFPIK